MTMNVSPHVLVPSRTRKKRDLTPASCPLTYELGADTDAFAGLLQEMRHRAGLTIGALAEKLGSRPGSMYQYFYKKRGMGGSSTMRWFLRYAEACECEVTLRFPSSDRKVVVRYGTHTHGD